MFSASNGRLSAQFFHTHSHTHANTAHNYLVVDFLDKNKLNEQKRTRTIKHESFYT